MSQRLDYAAQAPELFRAYVAFSMALKKHSGLEPTLQDLVTLRASQLNGCAFCVDMHVKEARLHGERELRLHHVAVWHESPLFSARELFSEAELAALSFAIVGINGWNRMAIGFAAVPGSQDRAYGLDKAGLN